MYCHVHHRCLCTGGGSRIHTDIGLNDMPLPSWATPAFVQFIIILLDFLRDEKEFAPSQHNAAVLQTVEFTRTQPPQIKNP